MRDEQQTLFLPLGICQRGGHPSNPPISTGPISTNKVQQAYNQNLFLFYFRGPYTWECNAGVELKGGHEVEGRCVKKLAEVGGSNPVQGLFACKMTCGKFGTLWPQPTGDVVLSKDLVTSQLDFYLNCSVLKN